MFQKSNRTEIIGSVNNLFLLQNDIESKSEEIKLIGDKAGILSEIDTIDKTLNALQATSSLSSEELKAFDELSKRLSEIKVAILQFSSDVGRLEQLRGTNIINASAEYELTALSDQTRVKVKPMLSKIQQEAQEKWISMVAELSLEVSSIWHRITSYNVCYTKLLRNHAWRPDDCGEIFALCKDFLRGLFLQVASINDHKRAVDMATHVIKFV